MRITLNLPVSQIITLCDDYPEIANQINFNRLLDRAEKDVDTAQAIWNHAKSELATLRNKIAFA